MGPEDRQFPEFFASQYGRLRRLGFLLTGDWGEGEELAQETLVRVYWRWSLVRRQRHPEAYARKVLVNRHRSLLRRLRLEARHAGRDRAEAPDLGPREELLVVREAIRRLPARQRTVLCSATTRTCPSRRWPGSSGSHRDGQVARQPGDGPPAPGPGAPAPRPRRQPEDAPMNLEELVRAALAEEAGAEPDETGAYDRFLRRRRRGALVAAASTGLAVALVLALAVGAAFLVTGRGGDQVARPATPAPATGAAPTSTALRHPAGPTETTLPAPPPVPVSPTGVVRRERQGFELTLPKGWKVDQEGTRTYHQFGQPWLVISPGGRHVGMDERGMTIRTAVTPPSEYPGGPVKGHDDLGGQSFSTLSGHRSSGRRPDGRAYTVGDQGGLVTYMIAWPYRCQPADQCPEAGPWRVLQLDVGGTGGQEGLEVRRLARRLVDSIRPITNALPPAGAVVQEEAGLFADAPVVVGRGGQGDYAWEMRARKGSGEQYWIETTRQNGDLLMGELFSESDRNRLVAWLHCMPSKQRVTAALVSGFGPEAAAKVRLEVKGQTPVEVPTFHREGFPFAFWVVAPLPPDAKPLAFTGLDSAGKEIGQGTDFAGYPGGCR